MVVGRGHVPGLENFEVPCGRCMTCRVAKAREWAVRAMHEQIMAEGRCSFITLTYAPERRSHLPLRQGLLVSDWQKFAKRLRHDGEFRFLACGEYTKAGVAHWHAALFGQELADRVKWKRSPKGHWLYRSPTLERRWRYGHSWVGNLTFDSAAYVAGYVTKKVIGPDQSVEKLAQYERVDPVTGEVGRVRPEFAIMSRNPGLGHDFFEKYFGDLYPRDHCIVKGQKVPVPKYYDSLLERSNPYLLAYLKAKRREAAEARPDTPAARHAREATLIARRKMMQTQEFDT